MLPTIAWRGRSVVMIDQRKLPALETYVRCRTYIQVAQAIEKMVVRGAPAIGIAAAYGLVLGAMGMGAATGRSFDREFEKVYKRLERTRPTARNLFWALERMRAVYERTRAEGARAIRAALLEEAKAIELEDAETNRAIGRHGQVLLRDGWTVLTHCNAGALATAAYGTALGIVRAAVAEGKSIRVFADETRPFLQGARLTVWELDRDGIPVVLITDSMAGWFMRRGEIRAVVVGADRIARNGDTANKIGTYSVAVLATRERRAVLRRGPDEHGRPLPRRRRRDPHRGAQSGRGPPGRRAADNHPPRRGPQSRLRRHPGRLHHGHRHRARHPSPALREELEDRRRIAGFISTVKGGSWPRKPPGRSFFLLQHLPSSSQSRPARRKPPRPAGRPRSRSWAGSRRSGTPKRLATAPSPSTSSRTWLSAKRRTNGISFRAGYRSASMKREPFMPVTSEIAGSRSSTGAGALSGRWAVRARAPANTPFPRRSTSIKRGTPISERAEPSSFSTVKESSRRTSRSRLSCRR